MSIMAWNTPPGRGAEVGLRGAESGCCVSDSESNVASVARPSAFCSSASLVVAVLRAAETCVAADSATRATVRLSRKMFRGSSVKGWRRFWRKRKKFKFVSAFV